MFFLPSLLDDPEKSIFNLEESEIYSLREAKELLQLDKYSYSLFAIWNTVIINIQRRMEVFGIENFLNILDSKELYNVNGNNLKDRWLNINEYKLIDYALSLSIITHVAHDFITALYWMKSNTNEEEIRKLSKEEIYALIYLLEKNLFLKEFKLDKRKQRGSSSEPSKYKRRKNDKEDIIKSNSNTHEQLLLKSGAKFLENNVDKTSTSGKLLDSYI